MATEYLQLFVHTFVALNYMKPAPISILHQTPDYVIISKPSGMLTLPDRHDLELNSVRSFLEHKFGKIYIVHRLDKDTSGIMVAALTEEMHRHLSLQFEERKTVKKYLALVMGNPLQPQGTINQPIAENPTRKGTMWVHAKGKECVTEYTLLENYGSHSLIEFNLLTGRTHQIRVHAKYLGHPVICDSFYGNAAPLLLSSIKKKFKLGKHQPEENPIMARLALHAHTLSFTTLNGETVTYEAPLYKDMHVAIKLLGKEK
jgi:23S rRNA pseudouridine1911/1915/1917 synthase